MDPLAFRLKNYAEVEPISGKPFSSKALRDCYAQGAERFGWQRRPLDIVWRFTDRADLAGEAGQYRLDSLAGRTILGGCRDLPFKIVRRPLLAPAGGEAVDLAAVHRMGNGLGGLPQRNGQKARGQGRRAHSLAAVEDEVGDRAFADLVAFIGEQPFVQARRQAGARRVPGKCGHDPLRGSYR